MLNQPTSFPVPTASRWAWLLVGAALTLAGCREGAGSGDAADQDAGLPDVENSPSLDVCDPLSARSPEPELFIGPEGLEPLLLNLIGEATDTVDVLMYQLKRQSFIEAFEAAEDRGVEVRLLIDPEEWVSENDAQELLAAGVELRDAPERFAHAHSKVLILDGTRAVIMSANLDSGSMGSARNYGIVVDDPRDVSDVAMIFDADWAGQSWDASCTRLVVSPDNSQERLVALIDSADERLDLSVMYLTETQVMGAVKRRARAGVPTRILLSDPGQIVANRETIRELQEAGIPVRVFRAEFMHAKLITADDKAFIGSQNMSFTSLTRNREIGALVSGAAAAAAQAQFEADWKLGETP